MNKASAKDKLLNLFKKDILPDLDCIKDQLLQGKLPSYRILETTIVLLDSAVEQLGRLESEDSSEIVKVPFSFEDNAVSVTKAELKALTTEGLDYLALLADIGHRIFVEENSLQQYHDDGISFLEANRLISLVEFDNFQDIKAWSLTTKGWQIINPGSKSLGILPDYIVPRKCSILPSEWTEQVFLRLNALGNNNGVDSEYIISFIDENKRIPYSCLVLDDLSYDEKIVLSLVGGISNYDLDHIKHLENLSENTAFTILVDEVTSDETFQALNLLNNNKCSTEIKTCRRNSI